MSTDRMVRRLAADVTFTVTPTVDGNRVVHVVKDGDTVIHTADTHHGAVAFANVTTAVAALDAVTA